MHQTFSQLRDQLCRQVIGQTQLVERLLIALLADGHLLVQGAPGLAKTRSIKTLADLIEGDFQRIQFTPDMLPADIRGSDVFRAGQTSFEFEPGPVFNNLVLADEINRAPAKVQSALLEAMEERQVSIGRQTRQLPELFMVMATQNPIEQEGTYPLPEAQLDRFLMQINIDYPDAASEHEILALNRAELAAGRQTSENTQRIKPTDIFRARQQAMQVHMSDPVQDYLIALVMSTRRPGQFSADAQEWLAYGASPRASIALDRCARARAWLAGRDYVTPDDIQALAHDCLRHRIILSVAAMAGQIDPDVIIDTLIDQVPAR